MTPLTRTVRAAALLVLLAGCAPDSLSYTPAEDLLELLPAAEVGREPSVIDLGTLPARPHLVRGWSVDEASGGETFVWSEGPKSEARFFLTTPRDLEAAFRGEPFTYPQAPEQAVTVVVNGTEVARLALPPGLAEHRVRLPEKALRAGENRLLLRYAWSRSPHEVDGASEDRRRLAVRWEALDLGTGAAAGAVRAAGGRLLIPAGTRIDYHLRLRAASALLLERLTVRGEARLEVTVEPAGGRARTVRLRPRGRPAAVRLLEHAEGGLARLSLAVPAGAGAPGGAVVLTRPAIGLPGREAPATGTVAAAPPPGPGTPAAGASSASLPGSSGPALAAASAGPDVGPAVPASPPRLPNVLVYLIDTLRRDGLGCYGNPRPVSPHIDAFARRALLFERAVAQSSWTRPAVASVFTGLWPPRHGVNRLGDALAGEAVTMAELLRAAGYRTHGVIANSSVARAFGFDQGFEGYVKRPGGRWWSSAVTEAALEWLDRDGGEPFFLYLHTVDPHAPYAPSPDLRARFAPRVPDDGRGTIRWLKRLARGELPVTRGLVADLRALYDAETAGNDASFGALVAGLERRGLWRDLVVVVLSDHGEEFHEHGGWDHGKTLYTEVLDVPLIARFPGLPEGRRTRVLAQHVDLLPTLLSYLELPVPAGLDGRNLLPLLGGQPAGTAAVAAPDEEPLVFSSLETDAFAAAAVTGETWRLIERRLPERDVRLYDRRADPAERRDLAPGRPVEAGWLRAQLRLQELARHGALAARGAEIDEELRRELRALGYID